MICGAAHPWNPDVEPCDGQRANHAQHTGYDARTQTYVDWDNPEYVAPKPKLDRKTARKKLQSLAQDVEPPTRASGFPAGEQGSQRAAEGWDEAQKALVDDAIVAVARRHAGGGEFTADEIWDELAGAVPVNKGLTARLMAAVRSGVLDNTGKTEISDRGGQHDHGQRLSLWYSLLERVST